MAERKRRRKTSSRKESPAKESRGKRAPKRKQKVTDDYQDYDYGADDGISQESLKKRHDMAGQYFPSNKGRVPVISDKVKIFIPVEGENCVRIVDPLEAKELGYYGFDLHFHTNVGPNNRWFICHDRQLGDFCEQCSFRTDELWETNPDLAKDYFPQLKVLMWVLDVRDESENPDELQLWMCPKSLADEILNQSFRKKSGRYVKVSHPREGCRLWFDRIGKGKKTKYTNVQVDDTPDPVSPEVWESRVPIFDLLVIGTAEEMAAEIAKGDNSAPTRTADRPERRDEREEEVEDAVQDCFGKEWDAFEDCDTCSDNAACREAMGDGEGEAEAEPEEEAPEEVDDGEADAAREKLKEKLRKNMSRRRPAKK